jgi:hypothetical protein
MHFYVTCPSMICTYCTLDDWVKFKPNFCAQILHQCIVYSQWAKSIKQPLPWRPMKLYCKLSYPHGPYIMTLIVMIATLTINFSTTTFTLVVITIFSNILIISLSLLQQTWDSLPCWFASERLSLICQYCPLE